MSAVTQPQPLVVETIRVQLNQTLLEDYERQAKVQGKTVEQLLAERLTHAVGLEPNDGSLHISKDQRMKPEADFKRGFVSGMDLVNCLRTMITLRVNGSSLVIPPEILRRLETRAVRRPLVPFLKETVIRQLEHFVGLR